jgi:hypothetical protein
MFGIAKDFRFAVRQVFKAPGFTLTVVLMLGLGIGVTTAIFSLIEGTPTGWCCWAIIWPAIPEWE